MGHSFEHIADRLGRAGGVIDLVSGCRTGEGRVDWSVAVCEVWGVSRSGKGDGVGGREEWKTHELGW